MIDRIAAVNMDFLIELMKDPARAEKQLERVQQLLVEKRCTFAGKPIPTFLKPQFISPGQQRKLKYAVETISRALNKFVRLYFEDERAREVLNFTETENDLFSVDPGYEPSLVVSRLDAFMENYDVKFLEFNCDSPGGIAYSESSEEAFSEIFDDFDALKGWDADYIKRIQILFDGLMACYKEFSGRRKEFPQTPTVAIVDWEGVSTMAEFVTISEFFESRGVHTLIADPRHFEIRRGRLMTRDEPVHYIYKRVIMRELLEKQDETAAFIRGIREGLVCAANPFRSCVVGNKKILALLTDPRFQNIYDGDEIEVIEKTVPWTYVLAPGKARHKGYNVELRTFVEDNKDKLVLKPASSYGGKDVYIGNETRQSVWEKIIADNIDSRAWVVQEFVPIPKELFPVIEDGKVSLQYKNVNVNPIGLSGKYAGTISRISDSSIINVSQGGGMVPGLSIDKREAIWF